MTTPADIIVTARNIYNDADPVLYRKQDTELLGYINDGILEISALQPAIFTAIGDLTCATGEVEQTITFADAQALVDVPCIHGGSYNDHPLIDIEVRIRCYQGLAQSPRQRIPNPCELTVRKRHTVSIPCMGPPTAVQDRLLNASSRKKPQMGSIQQTFVRIVKKPTAQ